MRFEDRHGEGEIASVIAVQISGELEERHI